MANLETKFEVAARQTAGRAAGHMEQTVGVLRPEDGYTCTYHC